MTELEHYKKSIEILFYMIDKVEDTFREKDIDKTMFQLDDLIATKKKIIDSLYGENVYDIVKLEIDKYYPPVF